MKKQLLSGLFALCVMAGSVFAGGARDGGGANLSGAANARAAIPAIVPTSEKIESYLKYTPYTEKDSVIKNCAAKKVAEVAIMAGCTPDFMPLCVAFVKTFEDGSGKKSVWLSELSDPKDSRGRTPVAWINGNVAREIGIDCAQGETTNIENKIFGNFMELALKTIAGVEVGKNDAFGTLGAFTLSEDEEACKRIGWKPYHEDKGFKAGESAITVTTVLSWGNNVTPSTPDGEQTMKVIAFDMSEKISADENASRILLVTEAVAGNLASVYKTKSALEDALSKNALRPASLVSYKNEGIRAGATKTSPEWYAKLLRGKNADFVPVLEKGKLSVIVTGDEIRNKAQVMTAGSPKTVKVELPKNWDALLADLHSEDIGCEDGACSIPVLSFLGGANVSAASTSPASAGATYAVMSPLGKNAVEQIRQGKRLDTLNGKRIAIVGHSFNAAITNAVIKEELLKHFPNIKIFTDKEVGDGGVYSVFHQSRQSKIFQKNLRDNKIDAVISGNCGCGLCTVKETGSSIAAEYIGIPTVTVGSSTFIAEIHSTGVNRGVPVLRTVEYPSSLTADSVEELQKNAREFLYPGIVKALTTQITRQEIAEYSSESSVAYNEPIVTDTFDNIQSYFRENNWSDGLPIGLPTAELVAEYLKYTPYKGEDVLGILPPAYREVRVYTVAVNAIMAGCPPEFMPLCVAFVKAMDDGEWRRTLTSTHGWTPYAWLNGPVARQLGIASGEGMMNAESNKALARFIELAMSNLAGYYIKENRMGTFGYMTPFVFAEDEKSCLEIGWKPYNEEIGKGANANTITAASCLYWGNDMALETGDAEKIKNLAAFDITEKQQNGLGNTKPQVWRTMCVTPDTASDIAKTYKSKSDFEAVLIEAARRPLWLRTYAHYWANTGSYQYTSRTIEKQFMMLAGDKAEQARDTEVPEWYKPMISDAKIKTIATMSKGETPILVAGAKNASAVQTMPGGGYKTIEIELPKEWDSLVKARGYRPLKDFYLK